MFSLNPFWDLSCFIIMAMITNTLLSIPFGIYPAGWTRCLKISWLNSQSLLGFILTFYYRRTGFKAIFSQSLLGFILSSLYAVIYLPSSLNPFWDLSVCSCILSDDKKEYSQSLLGFIPHHKSNPRYSVLVTSQSLLGFIVNCNW